MMRAAVLALVLAFALARPTPSAAQIYRWVDERGNSHYTEGLDSVPERYRRQATPLGFRNAPATPAQPTEKPVATGGTTLRFAPGERIMAEARINGTAPVRLIVDTGADRTVIAPRALVAAGVAISRGTRGQMVGATGATDVQGVAIDSLEVGDARVARMIVVSHDINQPGIDGLLGRDFLEQFNVTIDSRRGRVTIAPK